MPNKQNIKRYGWRKQYVVVSRKKILFYNSENHKQNADPVMVLDIEYVFHFHVCLFSINSIFALEIAHKDIAFTNCRKLFHVRPVTQGDVIRADGKDIPRIFQVCSYYVVSKQNIKRYDNNRLH